MDDVGGVSVDFANIGARWVWVQTFTGEESAITYCHLLASAANAKCPVFITRVPDFYVWNLEKHVKDSAATLVAWTTTWAVSLPGSADMHAMYALAASWLRLIIPTCPQASNFSNNCSSYFSTKARLI
jgi:hypothetical protein